MPVGAPGAQAGGRPLCFSPPPHSTSVLCPSLHLRADGQPHWAPSDMTDGACPWDGEAGLAALIFCIGGLSPSHEAGCSSPANPRPQPCGSV